MGGRFGLQSLLAGRRLSGGKQRRAEERGIERRSIRRRVVMLLSATWSTCPKDFCTCEVIGGMEERRIYPLTEICATGHYLRDGCRYIRLFVSGDSTRMGFHGTVAIHGVQPMIAAITRQDLHHPHELAMMGDQ